MQEDEGPLEGIVDLLVGRVSHTLATNLFTSQLQVVVPELVARVAEESKQ